MGLINYILCIKKYEYNLTDLIGHAMIMHSIVPYRPENDKGFLGTLQN